MLKDNGALGHKEVWQDRSDRKQESILAEAMPAGTMKFTLYLVISVPFPKYLCGLRSRGPWYKGKNENVTRGSTTLWESTYMNWSGKVRGALLPKGDRDEQQKSMSWWYKVDPRWWQWPEALGMETSPDSNTEGPRAAELWWSRMSRATDSMMQELESCWLQPRLCIRIKKILVIS